MPAHLAGELDVVAVALRAEAKAVTALDATDVDRGRYVPTAALRHTLVALVALVVTSLEQTVRNPGNAAQRHHNFVFVLCARRSDTVRRRFCSR